MPIGLDWTQLRIGRWAEETFGQSTPHSVARHLFREACELCFATAGGESYTLVRDLLRDLFTEAEKARARASSPQDVPKEAADILLLLLHLAHKSGFSLLAVAHTKFEENKARQWGAVDEAGVVEHVRDGA